MGGGQGVQEAPQLSGLVLLAQVVPQAWWVAGQLTPQAPFTQVAAPIAGVGQGRQDLPHELTAISDTQLLAQLCVPAGQTPAQASASPMHVPTHSFFPAGQAAPQAVPSQVALPPMGAGQGVQETPQLAGDLLSAQTPLQVCVPAGQALPLSERCGPSGLAVYSGSPLASPRRLRGPGWAPPQAAITTVTPTITTSTARETGTSRPRPTADRAYHSSLSIRRHFQ
jgi:hypothetical protein